MDIVFHVEQGVFNYRVAGIWVENDHVLIHRDVNDPHWSLPGGRVALGEASNASLQREFLEELGVEAEVGRLVWSAESFFSYQDQSYHEIGFYYLISSKTSCFTTEEFCGEEGDRLIYKWVPVKELDKISLYPEFLRQGLQQVPEQPQHMVVRG
jgi:8-oxo-dGTP pyrophosphatase MutT (NUDIX family)